MKGKISFLLVLIIGISALFCGCRKDAKNNIAITDCEIYAQVSDISGKKLSITVIDGTRMPDGDVHGGDITFPEGEMPVEDFGGEIPEMPEGMPERIPASDNRMNSITGIITVGNTNVIRKSQNGTEIPAKLSDISSGATLKITFDHSGNLMKILIIEETFGMPEQWEIPQDEKRLE